MIPDKRIESENQKRNGATNLHPSDFIKMELAEKGWNSKYLAYISHINVTDVESVINGNTKIIEPIAFALGKAFGTSKYLWLNLQKMYDEKKS